MAHSHWRIGVLQLFAGRDGDRSTGAADLPPTGDAPSSVRSLVNAILMKAVYRGANDVLFECFESEFRVRFKVEGECEYAMTPLPPTTIVPPLRRAATPLDKSMCRPCWEASRKACMMSSTW